MGLIEYSAGVTGLVFLVIGLMVASEIQLMKARRKVMELEREIKLVLYYAEAEDDANGTKLWKEWRGRYGDGIEVDQV